MYFLGDIHTEFQVIINFIRKNEGKSELNLIQVGDFGAGIRSSFDEDMDYLNEQLGFYNVKLYVIRGNHDDPKYFDGTHNLSNIQFLKDYTVLKIEGLNILFIGGAISVDRLVSYDYFVDEAIVFDPIKLSEFRDIDVVVTHTAPNFAYPKGVNDTVRFYAISDKRLIDDVINERNEVAIMFDILNENNKLKHWFYGHFHQTINFKYENTEFHLLGINVLHYL
jgi:Icc-related predicted phosphoesterase